MLRGRRCGLVERAEKKERLRGGWPITLSFRARSQPSRSKPNLFFATNASRVSHLRVLLDFELHQCFISPLGSVCISTPLISARSAPLS